MTPLRTQAITIVAMTGLSYAFIQKMPKELQHKALDDLANDVAELLQKFQDELLEEQRQAGKALAEALNKRDGK